jgi:hypothetical protein
MAKLPPPPAKAIEAGTGAPNGALFLLRGAETPVGRLELFARDIGDCPGIGGSFYVKVAIALETTRFQSGQIHGIAGFINCRHD